MMARQKISEFERLLIASAEEAVAIARGEIAPARVTVRETTARDVVISPPPAFDAKRVQRLRKKLKLSQAVFAGVLNVSPSLVRAWERGARDPEGAPQRLLQVAEHDPKFIADLSITRERSSPQGTVGKSVVTHSIAAKKARSRPKRAVSRR